MVQGREVPAETGTAFYRHLLPNSLLPAFSFPILKMGRFHGCVRRPLLLRHPGLPGKHWEVDEGEGERGLRGVRRMGDGQVAPRGA